jgi:subtilisin family serine protease
MYRLVTSFITSLIFIFCCPSHCGTTGSDGFFIFLKPYNSELYPGFHLNEKPNDRAGIVSYYKSLSLFMGSFLTPFLSEVEYEHFWIVPAIYTKTFPSFLRNHHLVNVIIPNMEIARIVPENFDLQDDVYETTNWGLEKINVEKAWEISNGSGITVASIDTGVLYTHESIVDSYGGSSQSHDYAWFDPKEYRCKPDACFPEFCCINEPFDYEGHGTHTIGTIAGSKVSGIGVAPGVRWIAAKGCKSSVCIAYGLGKFSNIMKVKSAEWVVCPTKLDGTDPDCTKGADIVSNSWGVSNNF